MRVREVMTPGVVTLEETATCHDAVARMVRHRVRHLPVVGQDGAPRGIVTDRDLRHQLFAPDTFRQIGTVSVERLMSEVPVSRVMSSPVVSVDAEAELGEAARIMEEEKLGSLPVVEQGRLVGIVTETDLLRQIVGEDACCADVETIVVSFP